MRSLDLAAVLAESTRRPDPRIPRRDFHALEQRNGMRKHDG
jgi:hypothetical protein